MKNSTKLIGFLAALAISATSFVGVFAADADTTAANDAATTATAAPEATETATADPTATEAATETATTDPTATEAATADPAATETATEEATTAPETTEAPAVNPFEDAQDAWYTDSVTYVYNQGLIDGYDDNTFRPQGDVTRAELTQILYKLDAKNNSYELDSAKEGEAWYAPAQTWAEANEITVGDTFVGDEAITREEVITMIYNAAKVAEDAEAADGMVLAEFADNASVSEYAVTAMRWAVQNKIVEGDDDLNLNPQANVTRAETAALVERYLTKLASTDETEGTAAPDATEAPEATAAPEATEEPSETPEPTEEEAENEALPEE